VLHNEQLSLPPRDAVAVVTTSHRVTKASPAVAATAARPRRAMADRGRLKKELSELQKDTNAGVTVTPKGDQLTELEGTITGPDDTPYAGGFYRISISIPSGYPFEPPKMKFLTKVWHPNISSQTGAICLDILKDQWSPALTIKTALLSLQALLCAPEPDDPQDAQVAQMYQRDPEQFKQTATFWTETYARPPGDESDSQAVTKLMEMGFGRDACVKALQDANGDETEAINALLSG
jgi:ubiquitin-conjugating enzyme (huntingtin interacting protein 2)